MTRRVRIRVGDTFGVAELDHAAAPRAVEAFSNVLPLEGEMLVSMWSGHACELSLPPSLSACAGKERAAIDVDVGALAIGAAPEGPVLLIAYGPCKFHTAVGASPATSIGRLVDNTAAVLELLEQTFDTGALKITLEDLD